jgi:hypothetical protein
MGHRLRAACPDQPYRKAGLLMGVEVTVRDTGATGVMTRIKGLAQTMVFGVLDDAQPYPDGTSVAEVYAAQEFGTDTIPSRPSLRGYVDGGGKKEIGDAGQTQIGKVIDGAAPPTVSEAMGKVSVAGVRKLIEAGINPPLKDGSGRTPLIDTGHLRDSIDWSEAKP